MPVKKILMATGLTGLIALVAGSVWYFMDTRYRKLEAERDQLLAQNEGFTRDMASLQADFARLSYAADTLASKRDSLASQGDAFRRQRDAIAGERDAIAGERNAIAVERDSLKKAQAEAASRYDTLVSKLSQEIDKGHLQIKQYRNMLTVDVADKIFFDSGSAEIKETGAAVLKKVGDALALYPDKIIRVVGHTDNVPLTKLAQEVFATNWELSVARAATVVRYLQDECAIAPERLVAAGRGPYQPVATNRTPAGRQKNRRIEIMLLDRSLADGMSTAPASP
jgi:chemotaxis protein MotB